MPIPWQKANLLEMDDVQGRLAGNIRQLRDTRGLTQKQMAELSGVPRATWANLESGAANPTLAVLTRVAQVLQVTLEELVAAPRTAARLYLKEALPVRKRGDVELRRLLPDPIAGMEMDRMAFPPGARLTGIPHTPGTREYLTCESGEIVLHAGGERRHLHAGDVAVFRGDQRHSYANPGRSPAVGYSVVVLAPAGGLNGSG
ncbi:MAG TPA: XRE family transcriptional regulator [Myxococcaceae bacterium]|nr:XRE family transcriptional regulator [Myxococcaceae bacterium]